MKTFYTSSKESKKQENSGHCRFCIDLLFKPQSRSVERKCWASLVVQWLRIHLPMLKTWIQSLCREDPEEEKTLQYSCLENPMDKGAWWATVHRATQSQTRLKWLSMHRMYTTWLHSEMFSKDFFASFCIVINGSAITDRIQGAVFLKSALF